MKGHHAKYKKHNAAYKDGWDTNHWQHKKGAYGHDMKHGGNHHNGYYKKAKKDEYHHDHGWNNDGWHTHHSNPKHDEHGSGYDWRFK